MLVTLLVAFGLLSVVVLLVINAVQTFLDNDVEMYERSAVHVAVRAGR